MAKLVIHLVPRDPGQLGRVLDELAGVALRMSNAELDKVGDAIRQGIAENFTGESSGAARWAPLAARTVLERRELGFPGEHPILQRTRQLKRSWTERGHSLHRQSVGRFAGVLVMVIGSDDERSDLLSGGDMAAHLPPRPIEYLSERAQDRLGSVIVYNIEQAVRRLGD